VITIELIVVSGIVSGLILFIFSQSFRSTVSRLALESEPLKVEDLGSYAEYIYKGDTVFGNAEKLEVDLEVHILHDFISINYSTKSNEGILSEGFDVYVPRKSGIIFYLTDGRMTYFKRIGGTAFVDINLSPDQERSLKSLVRAVRKMADPL